MEYNINGVVLTEQEILDYKTSCIDKVFAILCTYESCQKINDYSGYYTYIDRICIEFNGIYDILGSNAYLSLVGILRGMQIETELTHKRVKSMTFNCISLIEKSKEVV